MPHAGDCRSRRPAILATLGALVAALAIAPLARVAVAATPAPADTVYLNARVWTADDARPEAEALAVRGDRVVAVGTAAEVRAWAGPATAVVDLQGRRVVPGFIDAHWHFTPGSLPELYDSGTVGELQRRLRAIAARNPGQGWVRSWGWAYADFPDNRPHRRHLDAVLPDRPVWAVARDGHMALANTKALELAGITAATPDPPNGRIERDPDGTPTGEFKESARRLIDRHLPRLTRDETDQALQYTLHQASSYGITSVQSMGELGPGELDAVTRALAGNRLSVRVYTAVMMHKRPSAQELDRIVSLRERHRGPLLRFGVAKALLDGTIDAKTADMLEPYVGGGNGIPMWTARELREAAVRYDRAGFQLALHACGDRAIHAAVDTFEYVIQVNGPKDRRSRIEHIDVPATADLARLRPLGIIASSQPNFAYPDPTNLGNYAVLLGPERMTRAQVYRSIDDSGAIQPFGSDYPVSPMDVLKAIHAAVTRETVEGTPAGGWYPGERISIEAALRHFTRDGAYASFDEKEKGSLTPGRLADFAVLSDDALEGPATLLTARVLLTVMGGRVTYRSEDFQGAAKAQYAATRRSPRWRPAVRARART